MGKQFGGIDLLQQMKSFSHEDINVKDCNTVYSTVCYTFNFHNHSSFVKLLCTGTDGLRDLGSYYLA